MHVSVKFEIAPNHGSVNITNEYDGLLWGHFGAIDTRNNPDGDAYRPALHSGRDVGYTINGFHAPPTISADGPFALLSGHFASAAGDGNVVTFTAYRDGSVVGTKTVALDAVDTIINFGRHFTHIDGLTIEGAAGSVAMDDLSFRIPVVHEAEHHLLPTAHDSFADAGVWHGEPFLM